MLIVFIIVTLFGFIGYYKYKAAYIENNDALRELGKMLGCVPGLTTLTETFT